MVVSIVQRATVYKLARQGGRYTPRQRRRLRHKAHRAMAQRARQAVDHALRA